MATNRPKTRRRSVKQAFDEDDAPAPKRAKTELGAAGKRAAGATTKATKAKAAYDEDDDGFQFSRRISRRTTKAQAAPVALEPMMVEEDARSARPVDTQPAKKTSLRKKLSVSAVEVESLESRSRRRSARLSGDKEQLEAQPKAAVLATSKRARKSTAVEKEKKKQITPVLDQHESKNALKGVQTPTHNEIHVAKRRDPNAQKIMLPFADTPVITRNKEMRKGSKDSHRRSSTGLRGRRASSLIESGISNALPHSEVEVRDFYKYIEQSLPEPRRMKQLLIWCGARAQPEKPSGDVKNVSAIMAARAIQQELVDDFANKPELSDWFSREDTAPPPASKRPNPQNEKNKATLEELEQEIKRLESEKSSWESMPTTSTSQSPKPRTPAPLPTLSEIDTSLLDPTQSALLASLQHTQDQDQQPQPQPQAPSDTGTHCNLFKYTSPTSLQTHLHLLSAALEPSIDLFADGVHKIEQYRLTAERVADRVLGTASTRLEEQDRHVKEQAGAQGVGVGDLLRGLAGALGE